MTEAPPLRPEVQRVCTALFLVSALLDPVRLRLWDDQHLTVTQLRLLSFLYQEPGLGNAELADRLFITRPSVSALLDRLERGGYIRREISLDDRRSIRIWLNEKGSNAVVQHSTLVYHYTSRMIEELDDSELEQIAVSLERLREVGARVRASDLMTANDTV